MLSVSALQTPAEMNLFVHPEQVISPCNNIQTSQGGFGRPPRKSKSKSRSGSKSKPRPRRSKTPKKADGKGKENQRMNKLQTLYGAGPCERTRDGSNDNMLAFKTQQCEKFY